MVLGELVHSVRVNAIVAWLWTAIVAVGALERLTSNAVLWGILLLLIVAVVSLPAVSTRDWQAIVTWPLLMAVALATGLRASGHHLEVAGYVAIAAVALVVVVELDTFTSVELSRRFAVVFAVMTTMAVQALWTIAQYWSDSWLGTGYLRSQTELQWDFVYVTVVGVALGVLFEWYFDRFEPVGSFQRSPTGDRR